MHLDHLLGDTYINGIELPYRQLDVSSISCDSRKVKRGGLFVALKGSAYNGADFIEDAINKGASVVATCQDSRKLKKFYAEVPFLKVENSREFLRFIARRFYGKPSDAVRTIGITGTNGKTTVSYLIESILNQDRKQCGVIGTVNYRRGDQTYPAANTTPDILDNQRILSELAEDKIPYCVMEVSSHALLQERVHGIDYCAGIFTNLTGDHLDYHKTKENYFAAKAKLFTSLNNDRVAVINTDDLYGLQILSMTQAQVMKYGIERPADVMAENIKLEITGSRFTLCTPAGKIGIHTKMFGIYNVYNILAAAAVSIVEGIDLKTIKKGIERMSNVPGRLEGVDCGQNFTVFIDYAHTQDALENVLTALRQVSSSRILLVFGCGGDRDRTKRQLMGRVAGQLADYSFVTSDNPRSEDPQSIIQEIIKDMRKDHYQVIVDRKKAIKQALAAAQEDDIVLIAGKGHETYQVFADKTVDFNEREIVENCLSC